MPTTIISGTFLRMFSLKGKRAIITGAGSGIGQSTAIAFAKQGATVSLLEINIEAANETVEKIRINGGQAEAAGGAAAP